MWAAGACARAVRWLASRPPLYRAPPRSPPPRPSPTAKPLLRYAPPAAIPATRTSDGDSMSGKFYAGDKPTAAEVRSKFISFFAEKKGHTFVPSSSTIPHEDPTLLFANAGMNQFKPIFLGTVDPNSDFGKLKRAVNSQKCIRAGGKHNDLDDVGKDVYHHTFFEMLGNWSFGDYFKEEAISWAWELLTVEYKIDPERLYATYFEGDDTVPADEEARQIWLRFLPASRILPFNKKANFWEMGETGPCGPCTEIHYDRIGGGRDAAHLVNLDDPDVLEIWNNVFIQYNREPDGSLRLLPSKHVDTGMGLERVASVLQNVRSNYDTELFQELFAAIQAGSGARPYTGKVGKEDVDGIDTAYRVVADHIRTLTVSISDGGAPDNAGRGYTLRLILRRAIRFCEEKLHAPVYFFSTLVDTVISILGSAFPELKKDPEHVKAVLNKEEATFRKTLERGQRLFTKVCEHHESDHIIPGDVAWRLYDTFGFPVDLTKLMAEERGFAIDRAGFDKCKADASEKSRKHVKVVSVGVDLDVHAISELTTKGVPETNEAPKYNYERNAEGAYVFAKSTGKILAIRANGAFVDSISSTDDGVEIGLILDQTCFYAEQGGQTADKGLISSAAGVDFQVNDVQKRGPFVVHIGQLTMGSVAVGDELTSAIDEEYRRPIMSNHTATHVLNFAIRSVLGEGDQAGSLVDAERLRFDFSAKRGMTPADIIKTETIVADIVGKKVEVFAQVASLQEAKQIQGLRAMFGELYPDPVRIISVGKPVPALLADPQAADNNSYSVEFCGGTHVQNSGDIGPFAILSEESIAEGVRRIVALTGSAAAEARATAANLDKDIHDKATFDDVKRWTETINQAAIPASDKHALRTKVQRLKDALDEVDKARKAALAANAISGVEAFLAAGNVGPFVVQILDAGASAKALSQAMKSFKTKAPTTSVLLITGDRDTDEVVCLSQISKEGAAKGLKANEWVDHVKAVFSEAKGGGREETAQCAGKGVAKLGEAATLATSFASLKIA
eukprot:m.738851 g.738851  ORF g.738851 m.738851 type:complete len:1016 (+) comp58914_c0_seq1:84-3131(+)